MNAGDLSKLRAQIDLMRWAEVYNYVVPGVEPVRFREETRTFRPGEVYRMRASDIHSIGFSRAADVLVFEGPEETPDSVVLEPWANGERVPTFKVEPWMFKRAGS